MAKPDAIVARIVRLDPALKGEPSESIRAEGGAWISLDGDRRARLDPEDTRSPGFARVLRGLEEQKLPVYLEIDPDSSVVKRILIPLVTRVDATRQTPDGLEIDLAASHARHLLRRDDPAFADVVVAVEAARRDQSAVLVTEDERHEVVDIRPFIPSPEGPLPPFPEPFPPIPPRPRPWLWQVLLSLWWWPWWPWWWFWWYFRCQSPTRAQQLFDAMAARTCDPLTVPAPCIPFLYPDDGCWARAHEMSRLMIGMGVTPSKVWIRASTVLHVLTRNNPTCSVYWGWHVAPTICVRSRFPFSDRMVIDPSLFLTPVTVAAWKNIQNDPGASLTFTSWTQYWPQAGTTDPAFTDTNMRLAYYRLQLQNRSVQFGPPPYANCP
jgi:glutaminase-like protein